MNINKRYVWNIIKQDMRRSINPTKGDRRFLMAAWITSGCYVLLIFAYVATGSMILAWLMYGIFAVSMILVVAGIIWRFWNIINQLRVNGQEVNSTTRLQVAVPPLGYSGVEQMRIFTKAFRWQYGLAALFLFSGVLVPVSELKIGLLCLMELSFLWAIQRILSFQAAGESERSKQYTMLKLSFTLISAGFMISSLYFIMSLIIIVSGSELTIPAIYLLLPLVCGYPLCMVGCFLLIRVVRTNGATALHNEEHH